MKVSRGYDLCNAISISTDNINISGNRFIVNSDNFSLDEYGNMIAHGATIDGTIIADTGNIGPLIINPDSLSCGYTSISNGTITVPYIETNIIQPMRDVLNIHSKILNLEGSVRITNPGTSTAAPNCRIQNNTNQLGIASGSSHRYKHDISPVYNADLDPHKLYDIGICQYKYNLNYLDSDDQRYNQDVIGFIAEDIYEKYPVAADIGAFGQVNDWNLRFIVPPMLQLIQEQHKEIETLKSSLVMLNGEVSILKQKMEVVK